MTSLIDIAQSLAAFGWCYVVGAALVGLLARRLTAPEFHATAMLVGMGAVSLEVFAFGRLGMPLIALPLVLAWLPVLVLAGAVWYVRLHPRSRLGRAKPEGLWRHFQLSRAGLVTIGVCSALLVATTAAAVVVPSGVARNPDGYTFYLLKARMFFLDQGITTYLQEQANLRYTVPDHPPLIALLVTWLYVVDGAVKEQYAALNNAIFLASAIGLLYGFARRLQVRTWATSILAVLLGMSVASHIIAVAYTDLPLGAYVMLGAVFTMLWMRERRTEYAILGAIGMGLAIWTKNEGLAIFYASAVALCAVAIWQLLGRGPRVSLFGLVILLALPWVMAQPWKTVTEQYGVETLNGSVQVLANASDMLPRLKERLLPLAGWLVLRAVLAWNALLVLGISALIINVRRDLRERRWASRSSARARPATWLAVIDPLSLYSVLMLLVVPAGYLLGMLTSPDDVTSLIKHVTPRLIGGQLTPLFYAALAYQLSRLTVATRVPSSEARPSPDAQRIDAHPGASPVAGGTPVAVG